MFIEADSLSSRTPIPTLRASEFLVEQPLSGHSHLIPRFPELNLLNFLWRECIIEYFML
jgi:hypothetical protein